MTPEELAAKTAADAAAAKAAEEAAAAAAAAAKGKPTDAEAKLLKEVMEKKDALKLANQAAEDLKTKLKAFDGIDPAAVKQIIADQKAVEEKRLEAQGNWDKLKKQMNEAHETELAAKDTAIKSVTEQVGGLNKQIADLTVGSAFGQSKFITEEMTLTPTKARVIYGGHFEFKDGKMVGFDKPVGTSGRTMLIDGKGEPLAFDDAMKKIVDADADRDQILKAKLQSGAGSRTVVNGKGKQPAAETGATGREKIAAGLKAQGGVKK